MNKDDIAVGLANVITEGEDAVKELLGKLEKDAVEALYDWMDEYLVDLENKDTEDSGDEEEDDDEE